MGKYIATNIRSILKYYDILAYILMMMMKYDLLGTVTK